MNSRLPNCTLSVIDDTITVVSERPVESINTDKLHESIASVTRIADELDNRLAEEFGAVLFNDEIH